MYLCFYLLNELAQVYFSIWTMFTHFAEIITYNIWILSFANTSMSMCHSLCLSQLIPHSLFLFFGMLLLWEFFHFWKFCCFHIIAPFLGQAQMFFSTWFVNLSAKHFVCTFYIQFLRGPFDDIDLTFYLTQSFKDRTSAHFCFDIN